ncbi:plasminogen receptor (KT)-like [Mytilus californianus]|uniref:Plasminogen receptor (KT) n=1 Tax=Mytilus coruscus TaxID=42192 RepID=A0A6J8DKB3_MYTCO|nr:plasminogen receptor (KT)-like [Mytilus californianus]CAC5407584.1 Plasminogen receptor (KT) [Mytilus coruscus]
MGSVIGKAMDDNMKKQQEFMLETQRLQMERQIHMQNQMRERMMAMQIAGARDMFLWFASFYAIATPAMIVGAAKTQSKTPLAPILPLTFIVAYQYDMAYHSKIERIRAEADRIMDDEQGLLCIPHGVPTMQSIEAARLKQKDKERLLGNDIWM